MGEPAAKLGRRTKRGEPTGEPMGEPSVKLGRSTKRGEPMGEPMGEPNAKRTTGRTKRQWNQAPSQARAEPMGEAVGDPSAKLGRITKSREPMGQWENQ